MLIKETLNYSNVQFLLKPLGIDKIQVLQMIKATFILYFLFLIEKWPLIY